MRLTHSVVLVMNHRSTFHLAGKVHVQFSVELWQLNSMTNVYHDTNQVLIKPLIHILVIQIYYIVKLPLTAGAVILQDLNNLGVPQKWGKDEVLNCSHIFIKENVTTDKSTLAGVHVGIGKIASINTFQMNIGLFVQLHNRVVQHVGVFCLIERHQLISYHIMCDRVIVVLDNMHLKCICNRGVSPLSTSPESSLNSHLELFRLFWTKALINECKICIQCVTLARIDVNAA